MADNDTTLGSSIGGIWSQLAAVSTDIANISAHFQEQSRKVESLSVAANGLASANSKIGETAELAKQVSDTVGDLTESSRATLQEAKDQIQALVDGVRRTEEHLAALVEALSHVGGVADRIEGIARQTRMLALNATIEAARAGEMGKGFAVVANEVKSLAAQTSDATHVIADMVQQLADLSGRVGDENAASLGRVDSVMTATDNMGDAVDDLQTLFGLLESHIAEIVETGHSGDSDRAQVANDIAGISTDITEETDQLAGATGHLDRLMGDTETLIALAFAQGLDLPDAPFIRMAQEAAGRVSALFAEAVDQGRIGLDDLFDEAYRPIAGTEPRQVLARFTEFTDATLPAIQEPLLAADRRIVFCVAVDRNGYLPTHNARYSQPQRPGDADWNTANCRNRRVFDDAAGLAAARNTAPFLLKTYRRDMGGGQTAMMKDCSAPITVKGRHWGAFRMGYL